METGEEMKYRVCPFCCSSDLIFDSNITYDHGGCGYTAWIECKNCGSQYVHIFGHGYPNNETEIEVWEKWERKVKKVI